MICNHDRRGYLGASDTKFVMGNWNTATFAKFWRQKQGLDTSRFTSIYTETGSAFEHKITDYLGIFETDQQIIKGRIRVNFDAMEDGCVIEIKTHRYKADWKPTKDYIQQVQVQMWAADVSQAKIIAYELEPEDYEDWDRPIDGARISFFFYDRDEDFIAEYLKKAEYLSECIEKGTFPTKEEYESRTQEGHPFK